MSETFLRQTIIEELEYEPSLDATHVGVAVEKGIVTLTGHVGDAGATEMAARGEYNVGQLCRKGC